MPDERLELLRELTEASGISGYEQEVREIIRKHLQGITVIEQDRLGSIVCRREGDAATPRIMVAGHMDEIGFIVKLITDEGFIKFSPVGGWWGHVMLAQRVLIKTQKGDLPGLIGSKPPHILSEEERKKLLDPKDIRIGEVLPGIRHLNTIRNRLAHRSSATVTEDDAAVFLGAAAYSRPGVATDEQSGDGSPEEQPRRSW